MSKNKVVVHKSGIGFYGALFLIFLTLKLCGVINWSWLWVTAPLWIPFAIFSVALIVYACILICGGCIYLLALYLDRKK